jgi:stalled ribosome alternative rescue factor ArfA
MREKIKVRVNKQGFMNSSSKVEKTSKGKGSFSRKNKHKKSLDGKDGN